jgi:hypothetical protein
MSDTILFAKDVKNIAKTILPADTTAWVDLYDNSAGLKSFRVEGLAICSDDTSTVNIQFGLLKGGTVFLMGTVRVVTLSGTDGAAARVAVLPTLGTLDSDGVYTFEVEAGAKLQAKSLVTVTSAKTVTITGRGRSFEA